MSYRLLIDENVERAVASRLEDSGHDVEHVTLVSDLGPGTADALILDYARETDRVVLTYDDDFVLSFDPPSTPVLYVSDESLSAAAVATVVDSVSRLCPQSELEGVEYVGSEWL